MKRRYNPRQPRDAKGRWRATGKGRKEGRAFRRVGATLGALATAPTVYMPISSGLGYAGGRAIDRAIARRRR